MDRPTLLPSAIRILARNGWPAVNIAKLIGCSEDTVYRHLRRDREQAKNVQIDSEQIATLAE
jgi:IS30 family transposase